MVWLLTTLLLMPLVAGSSDSSRGGRLVTPTPRCSRWRDDNTCPRYNNDDRLSCSVSETGCELCGNYDNERWPPAAEVGGQCECGGPVVTFRANSTVDVEVMVAVATGGWYEFRLCVRSLEERRTMSKSDSQRCLDAHLLHDTTGMTFFNNITTPARYHHKLVIPPSLNGEGSFLQWKYARDNGIGLTFYSCADVNVSNSRICGAAVGGPWETVPGLGAWCELNCNFTPAFCPDSHCTCY